MQILQVVWIDNISHGFATNNLRQMSLQRPQVSVVPPGALVSVCSSWLVEQSAWECQVCQYHRKIQTYSQNSFVLSLVLLLCLSLTLPLLLFLMFEVSKRIGTLKSDMRFTRNVYYYYYYIKCNLLYSWPIFLFIVIYLFYVIYYAFCDIYSLDYCDLMLSFIYLCLICYYCKWFIIIVYVIYCV